MYGYYVQSGFMGRVDGRWILFATETDYIEFLAPSEE